MRTGWIAVLTRLIIFAVMPFMLLATALPSLATEGDTVLVWSGGGGDFLDRCDDGWVLRGLNYTAGRDLNSIGVVCSPLVDGHIQDQVQGMGTWGIPASSSQVGLFKIRPITASVWCPKDTVVVKIWVEISRVNLVHRFSLTCRNMITRADVTTSSSETDGGEGAYSGTLDCGGGAVANGMIGKYGSMVDGLGLHCLVYAYEKPRFKPVTKLGVKHSDAAPLPIDNGDTAVAPNGTTIYKQPNGDESDANRAGDVEPGGTVTVIACDDGGFCHVSQPVDGYVWHEDIGR